MAGHIAEDPCIGESPALVKRFAFISALGVVGPEYSGILVKMHFDIIVGD